MGQEEGIRRGKGWQLEATGQGGATQGTKAVSSQGMKASAWVKVAR